MWKTLEKQNLWEQPGEEHSWQESRKVKPQVPFCRDFTAGFQSQYPKGMGHEVNGHKLL